ncbi:ImmA/IrrE family metallo-endopeptidase [Rhodoplanes sp. TEM]|uniref:ImmA/IrrE family metallo-endopeptidase n=1 Tax=Rhodoplanes tepidamans TaxID=200616 RepID=A0ABT5J4L6_RHOTP|nr:MULTISPECIES: ImmA/IrrE family metallo-endopeptidase [Rhodoplanes]MDC7784264.1 ImmA/IrrE family metallo-endopeptidase [Rhodoplanes tepidamans]MDC7983656.1 ImmA/IrrE family metallo-endopeptidase [Rhodoplanes sp. TEM]MDQ0353666.1 Zn-dependent peptidase ImmA (M78 family) [Rhodoplanes tepidamans]
MTEFTRFGDPQRFSIAVRWVRDSEPRERRPADHGWSMGDLRIDVAGRNITQSLQGTQPKAHVGWYLSPLLEWLADNWIPLLHEEDFSWSEKSSAPALVACRRALDRWIGESDETGRATYATVQAWYRRHALRSAAEGGLLPDLFVRRFIDDIELSWSLATPLFAPEGFTFVAEPGTARLPVADVAGPLWEALAWAVRTAPAETDSDRAAATRLATKITALRDTSAAAMTAAYVQSDLLASVRAALARLGAAAHRLLDDVRIVDVPAVSTFSPAVAMFGGVTPNIGREDVDTISSLLASRMDIPESPALAELVRPRAGVPLGVPHQDGYDFAAELLEDLDEPGDAECIDIRGVVRRLGIDVRETRLVTDTIRGVALAGEGFGPTILVNTASIYNAAEEGRRFTLAHELCHVLFDRGRARRVAVASGPWVAPGIEKRANAFAAYLLMPGPLVRRLLPAQQRIERDDIVKAAATLRVSETALTEHIYNLDLIGEWDRERLRAAFRGPSSD